MRPDYAKARADIWNGFLAYPIWARLGWQEVRRRYRRTVFGPFWATLSLAIFITALSFVWSPIFKVGLRDYLPYLTTGLITWSFVSTIIIEGCITFTGNEGLIKSLNFPFSTFAFTIIWRNTIVLVHHIVIMLVIYVWLHELISLNILLLIPGMLVLTVNAGWIVILLGLASARFRDIQPLVANLIQVMLFITPIFWKAEQLGDRAFYFVEPNYLYHLVALIRLPLLGQAPEYLTYLITVAGAVVGWAVTFAVYARFRRRIAFWL